MKLSLKVTLVVTLVMAALLAGNLAVQTWDIYPGFVDLERREAVKDWERCRDAIQRDVDNLQSFNCDWAFWDDTYAFAKDGNGAYIEANLNSDEWFTDQDIDAIFFVDSEGKVVWQRCTLDQDGPVEAELLPADRFPLDNPLMQVGDSRESSVGGLILTEYGPMMVVASPILTTTYEGPRAGVLIMGRMLSPDVLATLSAQTQVNFIALPLNSDAMNDNDRRLVNAAIDTGKLQLAPEDSGSLSVVGVLPDEFGKPMLMIRTDIERAITSRGAKTIAAATITLTIVAAATLLTLVFLLHFLVVRPLQRLSRHVSHVGETGQMHGRLRLKRGDEIGRLADGFDHMMDQLEESRKQALAMCRQAGMAEVATGVLHNVGNVLNSINISADLIGSNLRKSRLGTLGRFVDLISKEKDHLGAFVTSDERGKCMPQFLESLHAKLRDDQDAIQREVDQLVAGIDHIKQVVRMQQSTATASTLVAPVDPAALFEDALKVNLISLERHHVELQREYDPDLPRMPLDQHKVLQVLINLISNAKKATCHPDMPRRVITLRVRRVDDGRAIQFQVQDNGIGIAPENLTRIFGHGFSSFEGGHGFGLHSGANAAGEMHGTLTAHSDGPGAGATFTLTIPIPSEATSPASSHAEPPFAR